MCPDSSSQYRPHLVFLCQNLPFPQDSGAHIRSFHTLRLLSAAFEVTGLFFYRTDFRSTAMDLERGLAGLRPYATARAFPIPQEHDRGRWFLDHMRSVLCGRAYTHFVYDSSELRAALRTLVAEKPVDLVHLDSLDLVAHAAFLPAKAPMVCSHHNVESSLLRMRSSVEGGMASRAYLKLQSHFIEVQERRWVPRMGLNLVVSDIDRARFEEITPGGAFMVIPNCVDSQHFRPSLKGEPRGLVFVGPHSWHPNRDAMRFFCSAVLPRIRVEEPDYPMTWLASVDRARSRELSQRYGIHVRGFEPDLREIVAHSACTVVPLRVGGGTRLKIVEAWSLGSPVVSTSVGAEGLDAEDGHNILLADDAESIARAVLRVVRDPMLANRLREAGRATVEAKYDWDTHGERLRAAYLRLVATQL